MKSQTHTLVVHVRFNRTCTPKHARREFENCTNSLYYPTAVQGDDPDEMRITSVRQRHPDRLTKL